MKIKFLKAGNGDAFLLTFANGQQIRNILIDGGIGKTYYNKEAGTNGDLHEIISEIRSASQHIDLLILTHIDNDHICGLLKWFEEDTDALKLIKKVWFNSGEKIAEHFKLEKNPDLDVTLKLFADASTGVQEALRFVIYLDGKGIWDGGLIFQGKSYQQDGIDIHVLSPNEDQLITLIKEYRRVLGRNAYTSPKEKDWNKKISEFIEEEDLANWRFSQDGSPKNGSSISFMITYEQKKYLFLADSHPKPIVEYLTSKGMDKSNPMEIELFKVAHHGSKANTNRELIELFKAKKYFISTDGTSDNHPNKRTLSRIVAFDNRANLYFNYTHIRDAVISQSDLDEYKINALVSNELDFK